MSLRPAHDHSTRTWWRQTAPPRAAVLARCRPRSSREQRPTCRQYPEYSVRSCQSPWLKGKNKEGLTYMYFFANRVSSHWLRSIKSNRNWLHVYRAVISTITFVQFESQKHSEINFSKNLIFAPILCLWTYSYLWDLEALELWFRRIPAWRAPTSRTPPSAKYVNNTTWSST